MDKKQSRPNFVRLPWDQTVNITEIMVIWKEDRDGDPSIGVTMRSGNVQKPPRRFFESVESRDNAYEALHATLESKTT